MSRPNHPKQTEIRLSPTSYVVLGLIGLRGPSTPYELKRAVGRSVAYFWPFPHSQLYSEPERLAAAGLLAEERESGGRNRKIYRLTDAGRHTLSDWLANPAPEFFELRDMALLQLFFSEFASRGEVIALAESQLTAHRERLAAYEAIEAQSAARFGRTRRVAPLAFGILLERAYIAFWTDIAADPPDA
jgi:PadR family transcriptional regulator AphA